MPRKQRNKRVLDYVPGTAGCWQIQMTLDAGSHTQMILYEEDQKQNL